MEGDGALRVFRVSVDVRSFKAGVKLPMRAASVFVKVVLPPEIVKLALESPHPGNAAKLTAPLRSHPPIIVERSTEVAIPNGYVALELPVSILGLAATLAQDPQLTAEVYHRDKYAADSILGVARIPMSPLMHEPRLDGYAPVKADKKSQLTIGSLRIVLAAEELGPVPGQQKRIEAGSAPSNFQTAGLEESFLLLKNNISQFLGAKAVAVQTEQPSADGNAKTRDLKESGNQTYVREERPPVSVQTPDPVQLKENLALPNRNTPVGPLSKVDNVREHAEYELAWEFEMWRRTEEARWRADLKEKEAAKLKALEEDAKKRELERTTTVDKVRTDLANLETKLRTKLLAIEKRERTLLLAEEEACLKGEALDRECAQRIADAESAAKRCQADCNQRLELEHARYAMLQEQCSALEQRVASANAAASTIENEFAAFRASQRSSSEAELSAQVLLLKHRCLDMERKLEAATRARNDFKAQVLRLAKELASVRQKTSQGMDERGSAALASLIEVHAMKANEERLELRHLKEQVERLQLQEATKQVESRKETRAQGTQAAECRSSEPKNEGITQGEAKRTEAAGVNRETQQQQQQQSLENSRQDEGSRGQHESPEASESPDDDREPFLSQISAFQKAEIARLNKQKADLLQTGVYSPDDRIIKGLDQEIKRYQSVDTRAFNFSS